MLDGAADGLASVGFAHVPAAAMRAALGVSAAEWDAFAASWDDLGPDRYMADGGRYRRRRHAAFAMENGVVRRAPHQPHYQSRDHNPLNGGIERWFAPVEPAVADGAVLGAVLRLGNAVFGGLAPPAGRNGPWHVEVHQFRIEASADAAGQPTPEGAHRDGVDWVVVMLVARVNVREGVTTIGTAAGATLGSFTLAEPGEAALVDDRRVLHGVTAVVPVDPAQPAWRDVLVATFRQR